MFISITRLRVRHFRFLPGFFLRTTRSLKQAQAAAGNRHVAVLRDAKWTFWTSTCWDSEAAMRAYIVAGPHRAAMRRLLNWCDEASIVHWEQDDATLPAWPEAHRRMLTEGRRSKVNHPSAAQLAFDVPAPMTDPGRAVQFK